MSTQKNEHNPSLYKPSHFAEGDEVIHTIHGWTGKVVSGSTEDRIRVDFGEHNCDFGSGKVPGLYWPINLRRITPPTDTTGSGREGETLWHLGPAKGGPNTWQDSDSILIAVETSKGWEFALVGISADDGIASMEDYLGEFYGDYSFEDIAYWIHERDIIKLLPLRAAIDSAQRQEGA